MNAFLRQHHFWIKRGGALLLAILAISCTAAGEKSYAVSVSPNAHIYTYFIINGIARGAIMTGKLHPQEVPALMSVDNQTRNILAHDLRVGGIRSDFQADRVLEHYLSSIPR